jgi:hypothetical protein
MIHLPGIRATSINIRRRFARSTLIYVNRAASFVSRAARVPAAALRRTVFDSSLEIDQGASTTADHFATDTQMRSLLRLHSNRFTARELQKWPTS